MSVAVADRRDEVDLDEWARSWRLPVPTFCFYAGPWENSREPTIVMEDPEGGDPRIIAVLKRVYRPELLHEICHRASAPGIRQMVAGDIGVPDDGEPG